MFLGAECLRSLHFSSIDTRLEQISNAFASTFQWVWDDDSCDFRQWLTAGTGVYWITGKPGSGKSTLLKHLSAHPQTYEGLSGMTRVEKHTGNPISAVYCFSTASSGGGPADASLEYMLRSLLTQIITQCPDVGLPVFDKFQEMKKLQPAAVWSVPKLHALFLQVLDMASRQPLCLFIDALDEYDPMLDAHHQMPSICQYLCDISKHVAPYGRVCVSSRSLEFGYGLGANPRFFVDRRTASDISLYVDARLHAMAKQSLELAEIAQQLVQSADGVFLWVRLVAEVLLKSWARHEPAARLKKRLAELPQRLNDLYSRILRLILDEYKEEAAVLLGLVGSSIVPLSISDMRGALGLLGYESDQHLAARVYTLSSGLIEVRGRAVSFTHGSLRRFLQDRYAVILSQGNSNLLKACLSQCRGTGEARSSSFAGYAIRYWASHARRIEIHNPECMVDWVLPSSKEFLDWYETFLCVSWQHTDLGSTLDDDLLSPKTQSLSFSFSRTRLMEILVFHSVNRPHEAIGEILCDPKSKIFGPPQALLLDEGSGLSIEIGIECIEPRHGTARRGWIGIFAPTLLSLPPDLVSLWVTNDSQASPTAREIFSHARSTHGLWLYAIEEYRALLDYCRTESVISQLGNITPLQLACFLGLTKTVMLLLNNGADPNLFTENSVFGTPFLAAVSGAWLLEQDKRLTALPFRHYCIPALLAAGADPNQTAFGYHLARSTSPIDLAIEQFARAIDREYKTGSRHLVGVILAEYVCGNLVYAKSRTSIKMGAIVRDLSDRGGFPSLRSRKIITASPVLVDFFRAASFAGAFRRFWESKLERFHDDPVPLELLVQAGDEQRRHEQQTEPPLPGPSASLFPSTSDVAYTPRGISLPYIRARESAASRNRAPAAIPAIADAFRGISLPAIPPNTTLEGKAVRIIVPGTPAHLTN